MSLILEQVYNIMYLPFEGAVRGMGPLVLFEGLLAVEELLAVVDCAFEKHGWGCGVVESIWIR